MFAKEVITYFVGFESEILFLKSQLLYEKAGQLETIDSVTETCFSRVSSATAKLHCKPVCYLFLWGLGLLDPHVSAVIQYLSFSGEVGEAHREVHTSSYKVNKSWGGDVQHGACS